MNVVSWCSRLAVIAAMTTTPVFATYVFSTDPGFSPTAARNATAQPIGQFSLSNDETQPNYLFQGVSIKLDGVRTGLSNFKLTRTFNNMQYGSTVAADPGQGESIQFIGNEDFSGSISYTYTLTADVAADATGSVTPVVVSTASMTILRKTNLTPIGSANGRPNNDSLSAAAVPLPVAVSAFSVE